ncbi:hypothetical protein GSI_12451 [Ganoderma sinense ZZ0214-1]|uniref:Fungal-type protein kinase domain-containing protein n=1 Tax=Ganoderma sinense ZZ0214-1 TaxID=1077348 RepID=A0A2G8RSS5_9APHY|nr:hypothetical protein GSI_12451 [Ganoderma sinense ZZ0214-1]
MANPPPPEPPTDGISALHIGVPVDASAAPSAHGSPSDPLPPPTTPPAAQPKFPQHHPYEFKSTPLRPSINNLDIAQKVGRERRLGLVDDTGMGSRFHQLGIHTFNALLQGSPPTAEDREKFVSPKITSEGMSERAIGIELSKTIRSVLDAAGTGGLRVLHTPSHKAKGDHSKRSDTVNDIGIYLDTEAARRVTTLTSQDVINTKLTEKDLESGDFGRRSWYHMAALGEIKTFDSKDCAFYMMSTETKKKRRKEKKEARKAAEADTTQADDDEESEEPQQPSTTDALPENVADTADNFEDEGGDVPQLGPPIDVPKDKPYIREGPHPESGLGQLGDYMHNLSACQHRLFSYGFYVQWRWARLLYFDRTGALVSEPFDWTEASSPLHDFVWKFAHMTPEQRGYDPTAQEASYDEMVKVFAAAKSESLPKAIQPYIRKTFLSNDKQADHSGMGGLEWDADEAPVYKLTVTSSAPSPEDVFPDSEPKPPTTDGSPVQEFLVCRPHFVADSLVGRCTRGYMAWDVFEGRFCFLKDSWRPLVPGRARPEHLVYERLHSRGVRNIATLVCGGDVGGPRQQLTTTHNHFPESKRPTPRVHYRIVTKEIGISLMEFANFGELSNIFMFALTAHFMAWDLAGILHRDVSVGNILIDPVTREGFLIDWDLSRLRSELDDGPVEPDRTGTWQFRSALSLAFPRKPYRLSDDIESFVHTYQWMVLRFHETEVPNLRKYIENEYEENSKSGIPGIRIGGDSKLSSFSSPVPSFKVTNNPSLQGLLEDLAYECFTHYQLVDLDRMNTLYGLPKYRTQENAQPGNASAPAPANVLTAVFGDSILDVEPVRVAGLVLGLHNPQPSTAAQPAVDPCDVDGFLSQHRALVKVFYKWSGNAAPRQIDQSLSQSQTHDSTEHFPPRAQATVSPSTLQNATAE